MSDRKYSLSAPPNLRRRGFLLTLGTGGVAAVATVIQPVTEATPDLPIAAPAAGAGYRDTQHVRDYYRTTKI